MRLTVLGSAASYAGAGQATSGHLVQAGTTSVMFDCGHGTIANLAKVFDPLELDAVFVTHEHIDHFADIYALQALLRFAPSGPAGPLDLYCPPGLFERMGAVLSAKTAAELADAYVVHELAEDVRVEFEGLTVTPHAVHHADPTFALIADETASGRRLVYTSDTAPGPAADEAASGAHTLIVEATLPEKYAGRAQHMTAREAGELAARVGAERLVLAHIWPTNDRAAMAQQAATVFGGPVRVAEEFDTFSV